MLIRLLWAQRFWPLFWTQFLGAFNDNLFKNALVILITFRAIHVAGVAPEQMVALSAAVYIAPFLLFSGIAGQLADKLDKTSLMRTTKLAELVIMVAGAVGFLVGTPTLLLVVLFLMGMQSAFFGPCKYAVLPEHLRDDELVAGNALLEMGTYLSTLLGTLAGGLLINMAHGDRIVAAGVLLVAVLGIGTSRFLLPAPSSNPDLRLVLDPVRPTWALLRLAHGTRPLWLAILGISWFWALGSLFLSVFPIYTKEVLGGDETVATLFLAVFSVGIGAGSLGCDWLSRKRVELGLVPIGALGITLFCFDLWWIGDPFPGDPVRLITAAELLSTWVGVRIAADLALLAVFGGLMIVPLYSFIQHRARPDQRARMIAANNVMNAGSVVLASLLLMGAFAWGLDPIDLLIVIAVLNVLVAAYVYTVVAEYLLRFVAWVLSFVVYRLRVSGEGNVPQDGPCVLVANHVSFVDWFVVMAAIRRPVRFVMYHRFLRIPVLSFLFRQARVIPITEGPDHPKVLQRSLAEIHEALQSGWVVCMFPEGDLTDTGELGRFRPGIERIVRTDPVPVVPLAINGLWGSFFSRKHGHPMTKPFRRVWSRVFVTIGRPVAAAEATVERLQAEVAALRARHGEP